MFIDSIYDWFTKVENRGIDLVHNPSMISNLNFYDWYKETYLDRYKKENSSVCILSMIIDISCNNTYDEIKHCGNILYCLFGKLNKSIGSCCSDLIDLELEVLDITQHRCIKNLIRVLNSYPHNIEIGDLIYHGCNLMSLDINRRNSTILFYLKCFKLSFNAPFNYNDSKFFWSVFLGNYSREVNLLYQDYCDIECDYIEKVIYLLIKGSELLYDNIRYNEIAFIFCTIGLDIYTKAVKIDYCYKNPEFRRLFEKLKNLDYRSYDVKNCVSKCFKFINSIGRNNSVFDLLDINN